MLKKKILIIEDEPEAAAVIKMILEKHGYETLCALDGKEGYRLARTRAPDLILLDLMLPEVDGLWVCEMIKTDVKFAGIPIIVLTARSADSDLLVAKKCGADDYIVKPFEFKDLLVKIEKLAGK
jgi:two-component system, OmpR family, alkaline phosphatase synthesis response regulator PhoP